MPRSTSLRDTPRTTRSDNAMPVIFHLKEQPTVPLEAEVLSPDAIAELSNTEIRGLTIYHGKRQLPVNDNKDNKNKHNKNQNNHNTKPKNHKNNHAMSK